MKIQSTLLIFSLLIGSIAAQIDPTCQVYKLNGAQLDKYGPIPLGGSAITFNDTNIPGGVTSFNFSSASGKMDNAGITLTITGTLIPSNGAAVPTMDVMMVFHKLQSGTPKKELTANAYVPVGPVDTSKWQYYELDSSVSQFKVHGGVADGMVVLLNTHMDMPMQVGIGASGKNVNNGASGWFNFKFMKNGVLNYTSDMVVDINVDITCQQEPSCDSGNFEPTAAQGYPLGGQAIFVSASDLSPFGGNSRFDFVDHSSLFSFYTNKTELFFSGRLAPLGKSEPLLTCNFHWKQNMDPNNHPKLEQPSSVYVPIGTIDPSLWTYYDIDVVASLCKSKDMTIKITGQKMMPMQVGKGANGKNSNYGCSVWLDYSVILPNGTVIQDPSDVFDINVDLACAAITGPAPTAAPTTPTPTTPTPTTPAPTTPTPSNPSSTTGIHSLKSMKFKIGSTSSSPINTASSTCGQLTEYTSTGSGKFTIN
ncbi:hypothetical protein PPL_09923 [Heterostelium album PN500]|uniref:Uncharacterized protein n=1 Tax=Heterostelium pallidum (strain ATCC 26659 / Pp 5 / PN500) TaxID=670386 RepID=D3BPQ6_HETP5|nr:hypothetical protein PPL_09923 [Heterostelium album PN500]EFA76618.1 hypothetical protein PPL_09923 [Heterostelium album PN500]|eukprot:XP_020428750.1 hypothetical protein PPL_09923 [Heterostelium album PN500]